MTAPAAMPGEEEIARALCEARHQMPVSPDQWAAEMAHIKAMEAKHPTYLTGFSTGTDAVRQARAVLALFAPILAEKEREIAAAIESHDAWATSWNAKLEAAEAALAAERERADMAVRQMTKQNDQLAAIRNVIEANQATLGKEFEEVWNAHARELYQG